MIAFSHTSKTTSEMKFFCFRFCFVIFRTNKIQKRKKKQHLVWIVENVDKVCLLLISRIRKKTPKCRKNTLVDRRLSIRSKKKYSFSRKVFLNSQTFSQNQCASSSLAVIARIFSWQSNTELLFCRRMIAPFEGEFPRFRLV